MSDITDAQKATLEKYFSEVFQYVDGRMSRKQELDLKLSHGYQPKSVNIPDFTLKIRLA